MVGVDFTSVEKAIAQRLQEFGLTPKLLPEGLSSGIEGLDVYTKDAQVLEGRLSETNEAVFLGSFEARVAINHPTFGEVEICDLVTMQGQSKEEVLHSCSNTFFDVTFLALKSLFDGKQAPGCWSLKLTSFTPALGKAIQWKVFTGRTQMLNDPSGSLASRLAEQPPIGLAFDTLTSHLAQPRIHWCKLYGENTKSGLQFGCSIDGIKSQEAETEMRQKFGASGSGDGTWTFRQFLVMHPDGEAVGQMADKLKAMASPPEQKSAKNWLRRLFGN